MNPPFFRFSYIIGGYGFVKGHKRDIKVHGVCFFFWYVDRNKAQTIENIIEDYWHDTTIQMGNPTITERGEEMVQVKSDEAKGLGFYRLSILVEDIEVEKIDLRY